MTADRARRFCLTGRHIRELRKSKWLERLPDITAAEIGDKSKGDVLVKCIAVIQIFWAIVQIIVRAKRMLTISQLELAVTGYAVCTVITYFFLVVQAKGRLFSHCPVGPLPK